MKTASPIPKRAWHFTPMAAVRVVIAGVVVAAVASAVFAWMPYQREQGIMESVDAFVSVYRMSYRGPKWMPRLLQARLPFLHRVRIIQFARGRPPDDALCSLALLANLESLVFHKTGIGDEALEHLSSATSLTYLNLNEANVTDAGIFHLKRLNNLQFLDLYNTQTTVEGRAMLRNMLPKCKIEPNP